jgi:SAM-dependent methyltransferase
MTGVSTSSGQVAAGEQSGAVEEWAVRLFHRSLLKQNKLREISALLGPTENLRCLDIGSDNGVISYLLRKQGGAWKSADLEPEAVEAIRALVKHDVYRIDGGRTPFQDNEFDRIVIIDFLEHIQGDAQFVNELHRIISPGGELIINVPHVTRGLARGLRLALGQTDEKHGHVRPGYTLEGLDHLLEGKFRVSSARTYSRFFTEALDALIVWGLSLVKGEGASSKKGIIVGEEDVRRHEKLFLAYSFLYPLMWCVSKLDQLLWWCSGYMLIVKTTTEKATVSRA